MFNTRADKSITYSIYPWIIVACGMMFYCFNYFLRISPSVMQTDLTNAFHITATQFGTLAGFYYWAYTGMQLPAGMLYDKFGVRFVISTACLTAVSGLTVFIIADNYWLAGLGRLMMGLGCAFAYIGTLKLASIWIPSNRFGMVAGLTTAIGMVSGSLTQEYLSRMVENFGYQRALHGAVIAGLVFTVILVLTVRNRPKTEVNTVDNMQNAINISQLWQALKLICKNKQMWLIGAIGCLIYLPSSIFLDLWGIPYLKAVYNFSQEQAVNTCAYMFYGWIIAGPVLGELSDKIKRRVMPMAFTGLIAAILFCVVFYVPNISQTTLNIFFFFIGVSCGAHSLVFALGKETNPSQISGTAVAVTNMMVMMGGVIFQRGVGRLLDFHTTSLGSNGLPIYFANDYTFALSVVPIGVAIGVFLCFFLKETYAQSQASTEGLELFSTDLAAEKAN